MAAAITLLPGEAFAGVFVAPAGTSVEARTQRAFIRFEALRETMIEEVEVISTAREFLWIRAIPSKDAQRMAANPEFLPALAELTSVKPPFNEQIRENLFGPSVVALLTRKLVPAPKVAPDPIDLSAADRTLELAETIELRDAIPTSTITDLPIMPLAIEGLLARTQSKLDPELLLRIAGAIESNFTIFISVVRDTRPSATTPARLPALRYDFRNPRAIYPLALSSGVNRTELRLYTLASMPLAPVSTPAVWLQEPWHVLDRSSRTYYVGFNQEVKEESPLQFQLAERYGIPLPSTAQLVRANLSLESYERNDLELVEAPDPIPLPGSGARGSAADLVTCVLLGLTPLLYTPESWFFLWLGARAKARARREGKAFGVRLWSFYALLVGAFWFLTLEQNARIAALVPILIGLVQLALPYVERDPKPVRAIFRKKNQSPKK